MDKNKKLKQHNDTKGLETRFDYGYERISSSTGFRIATLSEIVNGKANIKGVTLHLILESLQVSFTQFGRLVDKVSKEQVEAHLKRNQ